MDNSKGRVSRYSETQSEDYFMDNFIVEQF